MGNYRMTSSTRTTLLTLRTDPTREWYGQELIKATGLRSGTLYPILDRLTERGWLTTRREQGDPKAEGRPLRRYYQLTATGLDIARGLPEPAQPIAPESEADTAVHTVTITQAGHELLVELAKREKVDYDEITRRVLKYGSWKLPRGWTG